MRGSLAILSALVIVGCGSSVPPPHNEYDVAQQELTRAQQGGAQRVPDANVQYKSAADSLDKAKERIDGPYPDNERATSLVTRSRSESELSMELTREAHAKAGAAEAQAKLNSLPKPGQAIGPQPPPKQMAPAQKTPAAPDKKKQQAPMTTPPQMNPPPKAP
jgi:hypothetical protein